MLFHSEFLDQFIYGCIMCSVVRSHLTVLQMWAPRHLNEAVMDRGLPMIIMRHDIIFTALSVKMMHNEKV